MEAWNGAFVRPDHYFMACLLSLSIRCMPQEVSLSSKDSSDRLPSSVVLLLATRGPTLEEQAMTSRTVILGSCAVERSQC